MSMFEILLYYSGWPVMRGRVWFWCFNSNLLYQFADQAYAQPSFLTLTLSEGTREFHSSEFLTANKFQNVTKVNLRPLIFISLFNHECESSP